MYALNSDEVTGCSKDRDLNSTDKTPKTDVTRADRKQKKFITQ